MWVVSKAGWRAHWMAESMAWSSVVRLARMWAETRVVRRAAPRGDRWADSWEGE